MPRFTDRPLRPPPATPAKPRLVVTDNGAPVAVVTAADLDTLGPREQHADFHCVTTWSVVGLVWTGVPLREVLASIDVAEPPAPYLVAHAADGAQVAYVWEDAVADDVVLATHLNGEVLDERHGAPLRLVSPNQYGYKSVKHLVGIDFRTKRPTVQAKEHLRARVTLEERHPWLPAWAVRWPYRLLIPPTAYLAERALTRASTLNRQG